MAEDMVNHPSHYGSHPSGVECITITEHMGFNVGNAVKYLWRAGEKGSQLEDLRKAAWYVQREITRLTVNKVFEEPVGQMHSADDWGKVLHTHEAGVEYRSCPRCKRDARLSGRQL